MHEVDTLEMRAGYHFQNQKLLITALTHTSYANEHRRTGCAHNERMEFLGDAVLETVSSEYLYHSFHKMGEGDLSRTRASMVCEPSLAKCARELGLPAYLRLGNGEEQMGGRSRDSIIADAMEAVTGAIFLDGGFDAAKKFVLDHILLRLRGEDLFSDKKTELQEILQERGQHAEYRLLWQKGPDHDRTFCTEVCVGDVRLGTGEGRTKKASEQAAAQEAIRSLKDEA